ncbi:CAP domain-containing protein [Serinibacter arcticus]|uniref:Transporter n=1 Tax=Serinibacter arcticus TaxID=1655435 RepID=A0A4Z1E3Q2_9MICO|nr:CAP domain-containing protein [Serinibacter arcticus]TGO05799.1 Transporter [Serinibacter arcticus]
MVRRVTAAASALLAATMLVACGLAGASETDPADAPETVDISDPAAYAADLVEATNEAREAEGLAALTPSVCAADAAAVRAADLVGSDDLTHAPLEGVIETCAPANGAAENLVRSAADPRAVTEAWLDSPGHRENLLNPDYVTGAIVCEPDSDVLVCAHVFLNAEVA